MVTLDTTPLVTGTILLLTGLLLLGWGYKLFRLTMAVAGLLIGASLGWQIGMQLSPQGWFPIATSVVGAVVLAALMPLVRKLGLFVLGFAAAWGVAMLVLGPPSDAVSLATAAGAGLVGGVVGMFVEKLLLVVATSYLGAMAAVLGFGSMTGWGMEPGQFLAASQQPGTYPVAVLASVLALWFGGLLFQLQGRKRKKDD